MKAGDSRLTWDAGGWLEAPSRREVVARSCVMDGGQQPTRKVA